MRHSFLCLTVWALLLSVLSPTNSLCQISRNSLDTVLDEIRVANNKHVITKGINFVENNIEEIEEEFPSYYQVYIFEIMANGYHKLGDIEESESYAVKCLSKMKADPTENYDATRARILCLLGILQKDRGLYDMAAKQYQKALSLATSPSDSLSILNNYANLYKDQNNYQRAISFYRKGMELVPRLKKDTLYQKAKLLDNLGNTMSIASGNGLNELLQAQELSRLLSNTIRSYSIHRHLTQHFLRKGDTTTALQNASIVHALSQEIGDKEYEKEALSLLLQLNQKQYGLRYAKLSDSLSKVQQKADNAYALLKYDKAEAEKEALAAKVSRQRLLIIGIVVVFSVLLTAIGIIIYVQRKRQRAISETEQRIAKLVHDDIANNVFLVMNKLNDTENEKIMDDLSMIYEQARLISRSNNSFNLDQPFQQFLLDLFQQYSKENLKITPQNISTVSWNKISTKKKEALYKVLQELLTNTLKHSTATFVVVGFQQERSSLQVAYRDNGKGSSTKPSGGLLIAENRIRAVSRRITFTTSKNNGFRAKIKI